MQGTISDVITIDSDSSDEFESSPPVKKLKADSEKTSRNKQEALKKLNTLKEISAFPESQAEVKVKSQNINVNSLTIIIESDEISVPKCIVEQHQSDINTNVFLDHVDDNSLKEVNSLNEQPLKEVLKGPKENINNDSTVILDNPSEESEDQSSSNNQREILNENPNDKSLKIDDRPSTSTASEAHKLLDQFLEACSHSVKGSKYENKLLAKFSKMKKHFNNCDNLHEEQSLQRMLQDHINTAQISAADAVISFQRLYSYFLDNTNGASVEVPEENVRKIKKLEKMCKLLVRKLKQLEEAEVDFDDDSDSSYIQIDRYSQRLTKVYSKYCQLLQRSPHTGRLIYEKIRFVSSKYDEINRAITKTYKHNKFPTYYDVEKCIRHCSSKNNLPLTEADIKEESKACFTKLGNVLQLRRKKELYELHCGFITLNEDPANTDNELSAKLQNSSNEGERKMRELVEKYVKLQENNISINISEDSDDSHYKSSESD